MQRKQHNDYKLYLVNEFLATIEPQELELEHAMTVIACCCLHVLNLLLLLLCRHKSLLLHDVSRCKGVLCHVLSTVTFLQNEHLAPHIENKERY